jgi:multiple sugar transport system substrate-binding protein
MLKRSLYFLLLVCLMALAGGIQAQDSAIELTISGVNGADTQQWINDFVKPAFEQQMADAGKNVTVTVIPFTGTGEDLRQQYALDLGVGQGADILSFDGFWIPEFADAGLIKPLTEVAGSQVLDWEGWQAIPAGLQQILGYNSELYGIAYGTDAREIWYRTDLFEQAGLPADWQPTSWQEWLDAARTIKEALPDVTPIQLNAGTAMGEATTMQGYYMALLGAGSHVYDFTTNKWPVSSPAILDTLNLYKTIYIDEGLGDARYQLTQDGRNQSFQDFANGKVAMLVEGDYLWRGPLAPNTGDFAMPNRDEVVNFAKFPAIEPGMGNNGQDFVTISGGTGFILNPNTKNPEEAWALLSFMFSKDMIDQLQTITPRIRARTDVAVTGDATMSRIASEVLPLTTVRPPLADYNKVSQEAQLMTERVVSGEMSPEEAMQAYDDAVTAIVGEDNVERIPLS